MSRPLFAQERLRLRTDGCIALELKSAWRDGTRALVFEPLAFLECLAAMTPWPESNLLICHGLLAARTRSLSSAYLEREFPIWAHFRPLVWR